MSKPTESYPGLSIINTLENSAFRKVKNVVDKLIGTNPETLNEYKLPKVLMIGHESVGKSSLIENITKCQIFPRDSKICTKLPVRLVLKNGKPSYKIYHKNSITGTVCDKTFANKSDIYSEIESIMKPILTKDITNDEILVEITDKDVPDFEFIDLPGIRTYPEIDAKITTELTQNYLKTYPDSIIICVVPSVTPSLTSCKSIALIKEANLEKNCVLAMTMVDRLQPELIEDLLINRLVGKSDELNDFSFAGVVAIINRLHTNKRSLQQNDEYEQLWIEKVVLSQLGTKDVDLISEIKSKITLPCLLKQMDILYNHSIKTNWRPKISQKVTDDTSNLNKQLTDLGPSMITCGEVNTYITKFFQTLKTAETSPHTINYPSAAVVGKINFQDTIDGLNRKKLIGEKICTTIIAAIDSVTGEINKNFDTVYQGYKLMHFSNIKTDIVAELRSAGKKLRKEYTHEYTQIANTYIDMCIGTGHKIIDQEINNILDIIGKTFKIQLLSLPIVLKNNYSEDDKYINERKLINAKINSLSNYLRKINEINLD